MPSDSTLNNCSYLLDWDSLIQFWISGMLDILLIEVILTDNISEVVICTRSVIS